MMYPSGISYGGGGDYHFLVGFDAPYDKYPCWILHAILFGLIDLNVIHTIDNWIGYNYNNF